MATHSGTLAWKIPWTEEPGKLQSMGLQSQTCLSDFTFTFMNCEIFCFSSMKNAIGNLIRIILNLQIGFGSIVIFTILIIHTQEHGISLHLFMSSLISFISVLYFSVQSSFVSLGKFIPRYLVLFVAVVKGIYSLIFLIFIVSLQKSK